MGRQGTYSFSVDIIEEGKLLRVTSVRIDNPGRVCQSLWAMLNEEVDNLSDRINEGYKLFGLSGLRKSDLDGL